MAKLSGTDVKNRNKFFDQNSKVFCDDLVPNDVAEYYNSWATDYEKGFKIQGMYLGPSYVANKLASIYKYDRDRVRILDVAAGTGIVGEKLHGLGFRNIDGLDPSQGMLDICRRKGIYSKLICDFMTENNSDIPSGAYDCLCVCGGMGAGHIPRNALTEMVRIVKSGGFICIGMRQEYLDQAEEYNNNKLEDTMLQLQNGGHWSKQERNIVQNFFHDKTGIVFLYRKI